MLWFSGIFFKPIRMVMGGAKLRTEPLQNSRARENSDWTDSLASCLDLPCRDLRSSQK